MKPGRRWRRPGTTTRALAWGGSGLLLLVSLLVTCIQAYDRDDMRPPRTSEPLPTRLPSPDPGPTRAGQLPDFEGWPPFRTTRADEGWTFDLFTAPTLYAGVPGGGWSATRPEDREVHRPESGAPGEVVSMPLRAVEIVQDLFPVQLAGFGRSPRGPFGVFELVATREVVVARPGDRLGRLSWRVTSLDPGGRRTHPGSLARALPERPQAMVIDEQTGEQTQLVAGEPLHRGDPWAVLEIPGQSETQAMQEGGRVTTPAGDFVVTRIDPGTRSVVVSPVQGESRPASDPLAFLCALRFRAADGDQPREMLPRTGAVSGSVESGTNSTSLR